MAEKINPIIKKLKLMVLLSIALIIFSLVVQQRYALACESLPLLGMVELQPDIYVSNEVPVSAYAGLITELEIARARIQNTFGSQRTAARLLITATESSANRWGANDTASMHRSPWNSCVVLGPKGQNANVIAHELLHIEMQERVGFFRFMLNVPIWFDEGAALMVDYREPLLPHNIHLTEQQVSAVKQLDNSAKFFAGNQIHNYQAARMVTERLINKNQFFADLERIASGEKFSDVFSETAD